MNPIADKIVPTQAKPQIKRAARDSVRPAETNSTRYRVMATADCTLDDVLNPGYLWHAHDRLRSYEVVEISHEIHKFFVELYIVKVDKPSQSVVCQILRKCDWSGVATTGKSDLSAAVVEKKGGDKWRVRFGETVLVKGMTTEDEARAWLDEQIKAAA